MTEAELSVLLTDDDEIQELNRRYRGVDGPTDVLSFPLIETMPEDAAWTGPLGDVVISVDAAARQAQSADHTERLGLGRAAWTLDDEVVFLLIHGVLHLIGHDHAEPDDEARMRGEERRLYALLTAEEAGA